MGLRWVKWGLRWVLLGQIRRNLLLCLPLLNGNQLDCWITQASKLGLRWVTSGLRWAKLGIRLGKLGLRFAMLGIR